MGVRYPTVASTTGLAAPPASGAETAVITTPPLTLAIDGAQVQLWWFAELNVGTGTTAYTMRLRRGSGIAGALVYTGTPLTTATGNTISVSGCFVDTPGAVAGQQYTFSVSGTGTTGAWSLGSACILAFAL